MMTSTISQSAQFLAGRSRVGVALGHRATSSLAERAVFKVALSGLFEHDRRAAGAAGPARAVVDPVLFARRTELVA